MGEMIHAIKIDGEEHPIQDLNAPVYNIGTTLSEGQDIDKLLEPGVYRANKSIGVSGDLPVERTANTEGRYNYGFKIIVMKGYAYEGGEDISIDQLLFIEQSRRLFYRSYYYGTMKTWIELTTSLSSLNITASSTELNYVKGVTSNIQKQLDEHTHNSLLADNNIGKVLFRQEANDNNGYNYYFRHNGGTNDYSCLGTSNYHWNKAYIDELVLKTPLSVEKGGTGASKAADARTNLAITPANIGAASLGANTFTASQTIPNNSRLKSVSTSGTAINLIGMSDANNLVIGGSGTATTQPIILFGCPDIRGRIILNSQNYGSALPTSNLTEGRIFFLKVTE